MNGTTSGGRLWSRRAFVGLKSEQWGTLQAGRNLFIDSDGVWEFDPFVQQAFSSASLVRGRNWQQTSNNVEYHSPVFWGFDVQAQYAFGNQAGAFNSGAAGEFGRSDGIMLATYHSPLFDVRGIYDELRDDQRPIQQHLPGIARIFRRRQRAFRRGEDPGRLHALLRRPIRRSASPTRPITTGSAPPTTSCRAGP